jgi:hydroxyacid-oxoacid transhydrogenase
VKLELLSSINVGQRESAWWQNPSIRNVDAMRQVEEGVNREGIAYTAYDGARVEPRDSSYVFQKHLPKG